MSVTNEEKAELLRADEDLKLFETYIDSGKYEYQSFAEWKEETKHTTQDKQKWNSNIWVYVGL